MPSYDVKIPGSGTYRVNSPGELSEQQVWAALQQQLSAGQNPLLAKTTEQIESEKSAPFSLSDVAVSGGEGLVGAVKSLTDVFGAGSDVSNWLGEKRKSLSEAYTPERKAEQAREAELMRRASESGSTWEEVKQAAKTIAGSPIQSITSGIASSVPAIAAGLAALPASAPAGLAAGVGVISRFLFGAAQGVGEAKGSMYDQAFQVYKKQGKSDEEAAQLAEASQAYVAANIPLFAGSAGLGALDAVTGVESTANKALVKAFSEQAGKKVLTKEGVMEAASKLGKEPMKAPTLLKEAAKGFGAEALPEGLQGAYGQFVQNVAATRAGEETPYMQGVVGAGVQEGLVGGLTGTAMSPLQMGVKRGEYVADQYLRQQKAFFDAQDQAMADLEARQKQRAETEQNLGIQTEGKLLALPAPARKIEPTEKADPMEGLRNPIGTIQKSDLSPQVVKYIDDYRKDNGLPKLSSYSIEDVKDAMPGIDPAGEQAELSRIIAAKTGFTGQQQYTPQDVFNVAGSKNIDVTTPGFASFLERATGEANVDNMSQPQLYSAFKALDAVPASEQTQILPVQTNASRFTEKQYDNAVKYVASTFAEVQGKPLSRDNILADIKDSTGLESDRDANAVLDAAIQNGDLSETSEPVFKTVDEDGKTIGVYRDQKKAADAAAKQDLTVQKGYLKQIAPAEAKVEPEKVRTPLPAGYEISETETEAGTQPAGFQVVPEGRNKPLVTTATVDEAQGKVERLEGLRKKQAEGFLQNVERDRATIEKGRNSLERMEAAGQTDSEAYKVAKARQDRSERILSKRIERMLDRIEEYTSPLKTRPVGKQTVSKKGFTVTKDGKEAGTFPSRIEAEQSILSSLSDEELATLASDTRYGGIADRARVEQEQRKTPGIRVFKSPITPEVRDEAADALEQSLIPMLRKFGLMDVGLKVVKAIKNDADGSYAGKLIQIAMDAKNPIATMRHEAVHALKELGFFTPSQWAVLERKAKNEWIDKYLAGKNAVYEGETMSRLEAYQRMGLSEADIMEEAIADAFADFDANKAPPGLLSALMNRMRNFFEALRNAFRGHGFTKASDVFTQVEEGKLQKTGEELSREEKLSKRPASDIGHKRESASGRYVGAPDWVGNSPQQLANLRKKLRNLALEGESGRYWYERSSKAILDIVGGDKVEAEKIVGLIAIYSPNATVPSNTSMALNAYYQYKTGQPINAGLSANDQKATELLVHNKPWSGIKTNSFYQNLMVEIDPSKLDPGVATMDMWMALAFDYGSKALDQGPKYQFSQREIQRLANELGWTAHQVQAAVWVAMKGRIDPIRDALRANEIALGIGHMVDKTDPKTGKVKQVYEIYPERRYDHFRLAHKMGMEYDVKKQDIAESSYDFSNAINERSAQISWEATPGATTGVLPGILRAKTSEKMDYLEAVAKKLRTKDGTDIIAKAIGLPSGRGILGFSAWEGDVGAGGQNFIATSMVGSGLKRDVRPEVRKLLNLYCAIKGYTLNQQAVMWHVPVWDASKKQQNGVDASFNRALTEREFASLYDALSKEFGTTEIAPGYTESGFRLLNFTKIDNVTFQQGVQKVLGAMPDDFGGGISDLKSYRSVGDYISNDWTQSKAGEEYAAQIESAANEVGFQGRSDLLAWANGLRSDIEKVNAEFSEKYGWGNPAGQKFSLRSAEPSLRPSEGGGIVLGKRQPGSQSFVGVHYGNAKVDELSGDKYGTGLRGAERRRLEDAFDDRIKRRVYFYIPQEDGQIPKAESGVGNHAYTQQFDNILGPGAEMSSLYSQARGDANDFESAIIDAGYDGYAVPRMGMMVILNHNVPVNYQGTRAELSEQGRRYSLKETLDDPVFKQVFADTQVVDENGQPKVMYHGSSSDITEFKPDTANAIFFSPSARFSDAFATEAMERLREKAFQAMDRDQRFNIIKDVADTALANGDISKAEHKRILDKSKRYAPTIKTLPVEIEGEILSKIEDYLPNKEVMYPVFLNVKNAFDYENPSHVSQVMAWMTNNSPELGSKANPEQYLASIKGGINTGRTGTIEMPMVQRAVRALGFDAFYVHESGVKNIAVYSPTQIKSVIGNIGTYGLGKVKEEQARALGMTADEATRAQARGDIRLSLKEGLSKDIQDAIESTTSARVEEGWVERITNMSGGFKYREFRDRLRQNLLNRYQRFSTYKTEIERQTNSELLADSSAEAAALMADQASGVAASVLGVYDRQGGIPVYKNGFTSVDGSVKGPAVIFAPLAKYGDPYVYQMYQYWAGVQRGKRLMLDGKERLFKQEDIARAAELEKKYPEFKEIQKEWIKFNDGLVKYLVDTGVVSEQNAKVWTQDADYLPFYRALNEDETIGPKVFQSLAGVTGPKKLKGGEERLADFLETVVRNTQSAVHAGMRNVAANRAMQEAVFLQQAQKVAPGEPISGDHVLKILEKGKTTYYNVADPLFIDAMKSLNMPDIPFINFIAAPSNFLRAWVTRDPGFILANLMRDSMSTWVTSGQSITPMLDTFKEFGSEVAKKSPELEALMNAGVLGGYDYAKGVKQSGKLFGEEMQRRFGPKEKGFKPFKAVKSVWDGLEKLTEASDAATRIAVYKNVMAETGNEAEALFRAAEIMNFNRKGSNVLVRILTAAVPFLNARMQGLDVFYRAGLSPSVLKLAGQDVTKAQTQLQKTVITRGAMLAAMSVMYALAVSGDDEYEKQEDETKDNNWLIPGLGLKIPTPFEVGFIFKTIPERVIRAYVKGTDSEQDFADAMKRGVISSLAFNPIPQVAKPVLEAAVNFNTFTMRPIVGQGMQGVEAKYQVGPSTTHIAEMLGKATGVSPMIIDHIYKGYTGTMGMYLAEISDLAINQVTNSPRASKRFEQMPVIKRFMVDPEARGNITAYYKFKDEMDTAVKTSNLLLETMKPEDYEDYLTKNASLLANKDYVSEINKSMKEVRQMRTMIQASDMTADEKRDALTDVGRLEDALTSNIKILRRMISENR